MEKSEQMGMTLTGFLANMTGRELMQRMALDHLRGKEREAAARKARR